MNFEICQRCGGVFGQVSCSCDLGEVKCAPKTEPSLQLLIIDLGDSCVVKVEEGSDSFEGIPCSDLDGCGLWPLDTEDVWVTWRSFTKLQQVIEQQEDCAGGEWEELIQNGQPPYGPQTGTVPISVWRYTR